MSAEWYVVVYDRWVGPMTIPEVVEKIQQGEITWAHYAWKQGESNWRRICDIDEFQAAVPEKPTPLVQNQVKASATGSITQAPPPPSATPERVWFLFYNDSQFGPFSVEEVSRYLRIGKIHGQVHAWRDGMENWQQLEELPAFKDSVAEAKRPRATPPGAPLAAKKKPMDQRAAPRRPLVARILLANEHSVAVAVCRDVSIGGMQVLTDKIPGKTGSHLKLNVSPAGGDLGGRIEPFVAEGVIVRVLEDGRGFSFRFERLPDAAKKAIEAYIASVD